MKKVITQEEVKEYIRKWKYVASVEAEFAEYRAEMIKKFKDGYVVQEGGVTLVFNEYSSKSTAYKEVIDKIKDYCDEKAEMGKHWAERMLGKIDHWIDQNTKEGMRQMLTPKESLIVKAIKTARIAR